MTDVQASNLPAKSSAPQKQLSARERELLRLVLLGMKQKDAMLAICPTAKRPDVMASKLLRKPHVMAERQRMEDDALATAGVSRSWIVNELRKIGNAKLFDKDGKLKALDQLDEDTRDAVASVEFEEFEADDDELHQLPLVDVNTGEAVLRKYVPTRKVKVKLWSKPDALKELASLAGLKKDESLAALERMGPGLTVIVQQALNASAQTTSTEGQASRADAAHASVASRVFVNLPPPGASR